MRSMLQELPPAEAEVAHDLKIVRYERDGIPLVKVWRGNAQSPTWRYRFHSEIAREQWIRERTIEAEARVAQRGRDQEAKKKALAEFVNPYKVGDILHSNWGYDQTNVEFFQVLKTGPRSIQIREICQDYQETGFMSGETKPIRDKFTQDSEPKWVTIQIRVYDGKVHHSVPSPIHGHLWPTTEDSTHYTSSYA